MEQRLFMQDVWLKEVRQDLVREVERKLGLPGGSADSKTVLSLWQLCAWEATATGEQSRACSLFDPRVHPPNKSPQFPFHAPAPMRGSMIVFAAQNLMKKKTAELTGKALVVGDIMMQFRKEGK